MRSISLREERDGHPTRSRSLKNLISISYYGDICIIGTFQYFLNVPYLLLKKFCQGFSVEIVLLASTKKNLKYFCARKYMRRSL
jgi:hypothetical protein